MLEWSRDSQYNSFNSAKGLTYWGNYKKIVAWLDDDHTTTLPPPIECNLDPYAECNARCYFCIGQRYLRNHREEVGEMRQLPKDYMYRLVDFLAEWGVRGLCISGGGEPSLYRPVYGLIPYAKSKGLDVSFVTNGWYLPDELAEAMMSCRWVCFSVNAGDGETQKAVMGRDMFEQVKKNITKVATLRAKANSKVDFAYRMLILPENQHSIVNACKVAKELGVQDFNVRPVDFERKDIVGHKKLDIDVRGVEEEFAECHELETQDFHVYTIVHKFTSDFHVKHDFNHCYAALIIPVLQDGNSYLCNDKKMEIKYRIGSAMPPENILKFWGSDTHRQMMKNIKVDEECSRCTMSQYFRQIESVVKLDSMCVNFP